MIIKLNKSSFLTVFLAAIYLGAGLLISGIEGPVWVLILLCVLTAVVGVIFTKHYAYLGSPTSIISIIPGEERFDVVLAKNPEKALSCNILQKFISRNIIVLKLVEDLGAHTKHNLIIVRGMCSDNDFRHLKKFLLLYSNENANTSLV